MTENNNPKWTPGLWSVGDDGHTIYVYDREADEPAAVLCLPEVDSYPLLVESSEWRANLRLAAASPALYEALQRAVDHAEKGDDYDWIGAAVAALRLARGQ